MKVKGPLFSMKAKGSFDCITFKDINLEGSRHLTVAHLKNKRKRPVTSAATKEAFRAAVALWKELTPDEKALWDDYEYEDENLNTTWQAELSGYHKMIRTNVRLYLTDKELIRKPN